MPHNESMNYLEELKVLNEQLAERRVLWTKDDYRRLSGKNTPAGRLLGFLTPGYRTKEKLWQGGRVIYGYCYKTYTDRDFDHPYLAWVLFSPMTSFEENPEQYEKVMERLQPLLDTEKPGPHERKLFHALTNPVTEPKYFPLPEPYADGKLIYVSTMYVYPDPMTPMTLGIIPVIVDPSVSREIMYVPKDALEN